VAGLKEVAEKAGVSIRTVARALNDNGYVRATTRQKIEAVAKELEYRPNRFARSLRMRKSCELVVAAWSTDELHVAKVAGLEQLARRAGYFVSVFFSHQPKDVVELQGVLGEILPHRPSGVILFPTEASLARHCAKRLTHEHTPYLFLDTPVDDVDSVLLDRGQGVYEAVLYLAAKGRQRIAYLGSKRDTSRLEGFHRALKQLGRVPYYVDVGEYEPGQTWQRGRAAAEHWARQDPRPDAVQAFSDELALGFLAGLHDIGARVPDEVSLIGFDDRHAAALAWPPLTTVAQPNRELGMAAADVLLRKIKGEPEPPGGWSRTLPTRLVVRDSA
jgi:LacI family transcriptional regulator